jgi:hypothetical protein
MMTAVIILFFMLPYLALPQCKERFYLMQSITAQGINNGIDHYYQNLIIQDMAIAGQQSFNEISLRFDYEIRFETDQCRHGQFEISVLPPKVAFLPLFYMGYDISPFIKPEKADLVFHLIQEEGFIFDSLVFFDVALDRDSSFYTSLSLTVSDKVAEISVSFSRAVFHYSEKSYETFRDRVLEIDDYYAASFIADSTLAWVKNGFLAETRNKAEMKIRQLELERITRYTRPAKFESVISSGQNDLEGLSVKYLELIRLNNRYKAIINYNHFESGGLESFISQKGLFDRYFEMFDHFHKIAFKADFRFGNFIEGLSRPDFSNASLFSLQSAFYNDWGAHRHSSRTWCSFLAKYMIERGSNYENAGNQLRALLYYESAYDLSNLMNLHDIKSNALQYACSMMNGISGSYIEISRKSALTENPSMASKYLDDALDLYHKEDLICSEPDLFKEYENWLFKNFENQVIKYIDLNNYKKALIYLNEIWSHCLDSPSYPCPDQFHEWMRTAREGIYYDLLNKAQDLIAKDELPEAEQAYRQASELRLWSGYRIDKDAMESKMEVKFRQLYYEELIESGRKYYKQDEFISALYYFNKACFLEKFSLSSKDTTLRENQHAVARQIILETLEDGRAKASVNDITGAKTALNQVKGMLDDYQVGEKDSLTSFYLELVEMVSTNECERALAEFNDLLLQSDNANENSDYILAYRIINEAVDLSMDHLNCGINDEEAWYQKVMLESPADFQKMENDLNELAGKSPDEYLKSFQDLKKYHSRNKLQDQGIIFVPLFDRVMQVEDSVFLSGMLDHYLLLWDFDHALRLMERMRELGHPSESLSDEQRTLAESLAKRDATDPSLAKPWEKLETYTIRDKWYRTFRWSYKFAWLEAMHWKIKFWPFILK